MPIKEFEDISIPKWKLALNGDMLSASKKVYRVYKTAAEFVTIEAASATEAAAKSGMDKVFMIKSGAMDDMTMLDKTMIAIAPPVSEAIN